jgi:aconitate hydratase
VPKLSEFVFSPVDATFAGRALALKAKGEYGMIVGGKNYGQGSSREHAALCPLYLGVKAVLTQSFARIHRANLINFGIVPLMFDNPEDYGKVEKGDHIRFPRISEELEKGEKVTCELVEKRYAFKARDDLSEREKKVILAGGILAFMGSKNR